MRAVPPKGNGARIGRKREMRINEGRLKERGTRRPRVPMRFWVQIETGDRTHTSGVVRPLLHGMDA